MQRKSVAVAKRPRKSALARFGSVLGYLALAGGCANLVGLSSLDDEDAIGEGGDDGIGGSGGKGGSSGSAGKGGGAGEGGTAGEPTGAGGAYTGPVDCNGDPFEINEEVVRSCLLYESCYPYAPDTGISTCVTVNVQQAFSGRACTATAESCEDILDCTGAGFVDDNAPVTCSDAVARCEGNLAVNCGGLNDIPPFFIDCDRMGGECGIRPDDIADCLVNDACTQPDPGPGESYASGCVENTDLYYYCAGGKGYGYDCTNFAANCEETETGGGCFYSVTSCGADSVSCSGDTAVQCVDGERYQYDCGSVGLSCAVDPPYRYCLAPGCTTTDADTCEESCSGSELTFCYGGAPVTVDCQDYGFESCREVEDGIVYALCTNL
jgi:hypothetical protein